MSFALIVEQLLNGIQFGVMLFLMAAGLTLVFGIMNMINLAHGSLYMVGAFIAAALIPLTGSFVLAVLIALPLTGLVGAVLEIGLLRRFYARTHLDQVLVTFGLILVLNEITRLIWGPVPVPMPLPDWLSGSVELFEGVRYPTFRLAILVVGAAVAIGLYIVVVHTRVGMWVRAGASNRPMASALGVDVQLVFSAGVRGRRGARGARRHHGGPGLRRAGRHGRADPHPRLRRHRHRRHRLDPRRVRGRSPDRRRRHVRARAVAAGARQHGDLHPDGGHPGAPAARACFRCRTDHARHDAAKQSGPRPVAHAPSPDRRSAWPARLGAADRARSSTIRSSSNYSPASSCSRSPRWRSTSFSASAIW